MTVRKIILISLIFFLLVPYCTFSMDYSGHWASEEITELLKKNIINGDNYGNINPDKKITRAEFVKVINRKFSYSSKSEVNFPDVKSDKWYSDEFLIARNNGYITGDNNGYANPEKYISRAETCVILGRILNLYSDEKLSFSDEGSIPDWAYKYVAGLFKKGLIKGYPDGSFNVYGNITRAEAFSVIANSGNDNPLPEGELGSTGSISFNPDLSGGGSGGGGSGGGGGGGGAMIPPDEHLANPLITRYDKVANVLYFRSVYKAIGYDIKIESPENNYTREYTVDSHSPNANLGSVDSSINTYEYIKDAFDATKNKNVSVSVYIRAKATEPHNNSQYVLCDSLSFVLDSVATPTLSFKKTLHNQLPSLEISWNVESTSDISNYVMKVLCDGNNINSSVICDGVTDNDSIIVNSTAAKAYITNIENYNGKKLSVSIMAESGNSLLKNSDTTMGEYIVANFAAERLIECENLILSEGGKAAFSVAEDENASAGKYLKVIATDVVTNVDTLEPEVMADFGVFEAAKYYVWVKYMAADGSSDSCHIGFNNNNIFNSYGTVLETTGSEWKWTRLTSANLKEGYNFLKIYHREIGVKFDAIYITSDSELTPDDIKPFDDGYYEPAVTENISYEANDIIEAEECVESLTSVYDIMDDNKAYGKKYISLASMATPEDISFSFNVAASNLYYAWVRCKADNENTVITADVNGKNHFSDTILNMYQDNSSDWEWIRLPNELPLKKGGHIFSFKLQEDIKVDSLYITDDVYLNPETIDFNDKNPGEILVEVETGSISTIGKEHTELVPDENASGGYSVKLTQEFREHGPGSDPYVTVKFNVKTAGTYDIWVRHKLSSSGNNSAFYSLNNGGFRTLYLTEVTNSWTWFKSISGVELTEGINTIEFVSRTPGVQLDLLVVTKTADFNGDNIVLNPPVENLGKGLDKLTEVEELSFDADKYSVCNDLSAFKGKYVKINEIDNSLPEERENGIKTSVSTLFDSTSLNIWIRYKGTDTSMYVTLGDSEIYASGQPFEPVSEWTWAKLTASVMPVSEYGLTIDGVSDNMLLDTIYITTDSEFDANTIPFVENDIILEAESGTITESGINNVTKGTDNTASAGEYITFTKNTWSDPSSTADADIELTVNVATAGTYNIHLRHKLSSSGNNSIYMSVNGGGYSTVYTSSVANQWTWWRLGSITLNEGDNTLRFICRRAGVSADMLVLTKNADFNGEDVELAAPANE